MSEQTIRVKLRRSDWSQSAVLGDRGAAARDFADIVSGQIVGTVLPWSCRQGLIRAAKAHGITRFEANLIIAAVQDQMGVGRQRIVAVPSQRSAEIAASLALFLMVEIGIVAAAWYWLS